MTKLLLLFVTLIMTAVHALADEKHLISPTCVADGIEYDCGRPIFTETGFTFRTIDPEVRGQWEVYRAYLSFDANDDTLLAASGNDEADSRFFLDISNVDWSRFRRDYFSYRNPGNPEEDYNERGYYIYVKFTAEDGRSDARVFMYAVPTVMPSVPVITNAYFEVENYNFDEDSMWYECDPPSCFIAEAYSENATRMFVQIYYPGSAEHYFTVDDWRNETYSPGCMFVELPEVTDGHGRYRHEDAEWDDLLVFLGDNSDGTSFESEPVLLGDYITDPAIRARIDELHTQVGIDDIAATYTLTLRRDGNVMSAVSDSDTVVTLEVVGIDGTKRVAVEGCGSASADLSGLAPGVYVVHASDGESVDTGKIMIND